MSWAIEINCVCTIHSHSYTLLYRFGLQYFRDLSIKFVIVFIWLLFSLRNHVIKQMPFTMFCSDWIVLKVFMLLNEVARWQPHARTSMCIVHELHLKKKWTETETVSTRAVNIFNFLRLHHLKSPPVHHARVRWQATAHCFTTSLYAHELCARTHTRVCSQCTVLYSWTIFHFNLI